MKTTLILAAFFLMAGITACKKSNDETTQLNIRLTDNPYNASAVNVDIEQVRVKFEDDDRDDEGWVNLETRAGIYNLLDYQNGIDTLIATGMVPRRDVKEIRFVLGQDNSIVIDGNSYPLTIPSGSSSGLKIKINKPLRSDFEWLLIDFDAALSIFQEGTGDYKLRPVLKVK